MTLGDQNNESNNDENGINSNNTNNNPFSFKKFITKQSDLTSSTSTLSSATNFFLPNSSIINENDDDLLINKNKISKNSNASSSNSNPFSFRQFLNENSNRRNYADANQYDERKSSIILNDEDNDFDDYNSDNEKDIIPNIKNKLNNEAEAIQIPLLLPPISPPLSFNKASPYLPDFINESIGLSNDEKLPANNENPYLVLENISSIISPPSTSPLTLPPIIQSDKSKNSYFDLESKLPFNNELKLSTDNQKSSIIDSQVPGYFDLEANLNGDFNSFNDQKMINNKNSNYQKQLNEKKLIIVEQQKKLEQYQKQLDAIKKKEDQETKTLENIILNIEKNLEKTTKRAIEAENLVDKLKTENKSLKSQVQSLSNENELLKLNSNNSSSMKQIINGYSEQLSQAAGSGEQIIKQLLSGVDTLKLLAKSLESIGKIHEID